MAHQGGELVDSSTKYRYSRADPHPALRATLSQWEREFLHDFRPSPFGRGWREAPGEGHPTIVLLMNKAS